MDIETTKPWWLSKGVIGGLVAVVAGVFGVAEADAAQATDLVLDIVGAAGGLLAIYGRVVAKRAVR